MIGKKLVFVFRSSLFARAGKTVHGCASTGPIFQNLLLNHLIDQFFCYSRLFVQNFCQIVEVKLALGFRFRLQTLDDLIFLPLRNPYILFLYKKSGDTSKRISCFSEKIILTQHLNQFN